MDELISRITGKVGIDEATARSAVQVILSFLYQEGDRDKVIALAERIPGAADFIDTNADNDAATLGGLGGLMGGGVMAVLGQLQALGLGMGEVQGVAQETIDFARERGGDALIRDIVGSIPGLSQFV